MTTLLILLHLSIIPLFWRFAHEDAAQLSVPIYLNQLFRLVTCLVFLLRFSLQHSVHAPPFALLAQLTPLALLHSSPALILSLFPLGKGDRRFLLSLSLLLSPLYFCQAVLLSLGLCLIYQLFLSKKHLLKQRLVPLLPYLTCGSSPFLFHEVISLL